MLDGAIKKDDAKKRAIEHTDQLVDISGRRSFTVYSTRRQILRYLEWYNEISQIGGHINSLAEEIFDRFPAETD
jgi:hypothetical protein